MKFKGLLVVLVLVVAAATLFTAVAGHGSSVRYMGSVETVRSSVARGGSGSKQGDILISEMILPLPGDPGIYGVATCGNPGKKTFEAPGINPVVPAFGGNILVTRDQFDEQGRFVATVISAADLSTIDPAQVCPNKRWTVTDFIPTAFIAVLSETAVFDDGSQKSLGYEVARCYVPDGVAIEPGNQYACDLLEVYHTGAPTS